MSSTLDKIAEILAKAESLYREAILTKAEVATFRYEFTRLQDRLDKLLERQAELNARLAVAEKQAEAVTTLRERVSELEARFKSSLDAALMANAREAVGQHVQEFLRQNIQQILAAQSFTPAIGHRKTED